MNELIQLGQTFGAPGLLIGFMLWDRMQQNALTRERTAADVAMAQAITTLAGKLDHVR